MVFDRLRSALTGQPAGPGQQLKEALAPIRAVSEPLYQRTVGFVHDGSGPEVLLELDAAHQPDLERLLIEPGKVQSHTRWLTEAEKQKLRQAGIQADPKLIHDARSRYYRSTDSSQPQWLRFGYLLATLGSGPNRRVEGVPLWLTALLNDIATVINKGGLRYLQWPPERFADLLRHDGAAEADIPTIVFLAMSEQENVVGWQSVRPHELPGIDNYLLGFGHLIPPSTVRRLGAMARVGVAERATADLRVAQVLAPLLAELAIDKAKGARTAAVLALSQLPGPLQGAVLRPVLVTAPAAASGELVEYLARTDAGGALLDEAMAAGAQLGAAVEKANARRHALRAAPQAQLLVLPPFNPIPDQLDEGRAVAELRRFVDSQIDRIQASDHAYQVKRVRELRQITDADLRQVAAAAMGRLPAPKQLQGFSVNALAQAVPSFNLIHLIRLDTSGRPTTAPWLVQARADEITDLRQVEDALHRTGARSEALETLPQLGRVSSYWLTLQPEVTWPWFAQSLDVLQAWLGGSTSDVGDALAVLEAFPAIPPALLPTVASVAVGDSRRNRPLAQALLARHGSARDLAEQGLTDSRGEIRTASAAWLGRLADPAAIPALRTALAKEKREVVRAAMLNALADVGDDISGDLAPARLLAEANAGLRARIPAALDWFGFEQLPRLAWRDGTQVDPAIGRWWVVLANKMKDPDGSGLVDLYLGRLGPDAAAALGRFALASWIAQDTRHPPHEESRAHADAESRRRYDWAQDYLKRVQVNPQRAQHLAQALQRAAIPLEEYARDAYAEHQARYLGSATANRGLLALTVRMPGSELANAVQSYLRSHGGRRTQADALMYPLHANGEPAAVQLLLSISRRFKQASVQATATRLVETLADKRGWTADELADRTIPTAGFDPDALLRLDFGSRQFLGRATPSGMIELSTTDETSIKALPAARAADDAELVTVAKKQLAASRKELKAVLAQQTARLYEAMCSGRTWTVPDWREFLLEHPLVGQLLSRLVWLENPGPGQRPFRPTEDGSLIDAEDDSIELAEDARVALAHRVSVGDAVATVWRGHLSDYEVVPLFAQFDNPLPEVDLQTTQTRDLQGHLTDTFSFRGVATKRGYQRGPAEDGAWFAEYTKGFAAAGLTAVQEFTGSYVPEENFACATIGLSFRGVRNRAVPLAEVPAVLLAECYADYAALAALGPFDPDWEKKAGA